jgi:hypothetical protein
MTEWMPVSCWFRCGGRLLRAAGHELVLSGPAVSPGSVAGLLREHREAIRAAAAAVGAENVRVFGSLARASGLGSLYPAVIALVAAVRQSAGG